jgi:beta-aspartyl-peptidase (threonine type)
MIGVDANGNASLIFNSEGMYRGMRSYDDRAVVEIYR